MNTSLAQTNAVEDRLLGAIQPREILFILVNECRQAVPYELACFIPNPDTALPLTISSIAEADRNAPFSQYLRRLFPVIGLDPARPVPKLLVPDSLPQPLREEWNSWLPAQVLLCPLVLESGRTGGVLLLGRTQPWSNPEAVVLQRLCRVGGAMLRSLCRPSLAKRLRHFLRFRPAWLILAAVLLAAAIPIRSAVLGMGEVVPLDPMVVRAPVDGIVDRMIVHPFQIVAPGEQLVLFEQLKIDNQITVARETLNGAEEELRQAKQGALFLTDSTLRLPELEVKREEARAELRYLLELKGRMGVTAPMSGVALVDDYPSWAGKSVSMGERLLTIADPAQVELKIWIPAGDVGLLSVNDTVQLYLNVAPQDPIVGTVRSIGYQPKDSPKGVLAYEVMAAITQDVPEMRIGYFGTGRVFGRQMPLGFYLLRRPLAFLRIWLGI